MKKLQRTALKLNDVISDAALSTKLSGEEYSVIRTNQQSVILGKHDVHEISHLHVKEEGASFTFPELSEDMRQKLFGQADNVNLQVYLD